MQLSVVLPVFNEARTLLRALLAVAHALPAVSKEIILVDDGSRDGTREWIRANVPDGLGPMTDLRLDASGNLACDGTAGHAPVLLRACFHAANSGKGRGVQTGLAQARGDVVVIQDGDLEYDPADWAGMHALIIGPDRADIVFGSRLRSPESRFPYRRQYLANMLLSWLFSALYRQRLTDVEVCYKMFRREVARHLRITCDDFGCEIQLAAQMVRPRRWRIREVAVRYQGRRYEEGKGIGWRDGLKALWYLLWFRVAPQGRGTPAIAPR